MPVPGGFGTGIEIGQFLAGDRFQPYDHAEIYIGQPDKDGPNGYTCSAYPNNTDPGCTGRHVLPYPPAKLPGSIWSSGIITLTPAQRAGILGWCEAHPRVPYSWADYGALALHALHIPAPGLKAYIASTASMICSQYTDAAYAANGVHLFSDQRWSGYVTPGDLADLLQAKARLAVPGG